MNNIKHHISEVITTDLEEGFIITGYDNLEILRCLPDNCVDCIYIDPPYLTNKIWEKNGWSFEDKFDDMWVFLFFLAERLVEAKRLMRTRHYKIIDDELYEDDEICKYAPRRDKILSDYSGKGKIKKLMKGIDIGASIFVHIDYRTNSEIKTYLMDPLFGEGALTWSEVQALFSIKLGKHVHTPDAVQEVIINQGPDIIMDFFAGSHSTAAAAWKTGRRFISIEKNKSEQLFLDQIKDFTFGQLRTD